MNAENLRLAGAFVDAGYVRQGGECLRARENLVKVLLSQRALPRAGWDEASIEHLLAELALMDSNNFKDAVGFGEREGRVRSALVRRRHYRLGHGIGRSGDITAVQPKAAGSSLISQLTRALALSAIRQCGIRSAKAALVLPVATGMSIALTLMTLKATRRAEGPENARYVLWPRIDQKACFKAIYTAGLVPVVIETVRGGGSGGSGAAGGTSGAAGSNGNGNSNGEDANSDVVRTDLDALRAKIDELGSDKVLCVLSTTSCFAPRARDDVEAIARICKETGVGHVINNAYGLIDSKCCHAVNQACRVGRVDAFVQSTDKNLMVPVGGAIVAGPDKKFIARIGQNYPGRASMSPILDLFVTFLEMGAPGWKQALQARAASVPVLIEALRTVAEKHGERLLQTSKANNISFAVTLSQVHDPTEVGAWLFKRGVSGARVVAPGARKTIEETDFEHWGASLGTDGVGGAGEGYPVAYMTFAASMGMDAAEDVPRLCAKLDAALTKFVVVAGAARAAGAGETQKGGDDE
jgi:O-phospho-L-seryl-tRNASec:L-selenocysteinyl-tRNA synthase